MPSRQAELTASALFGRGIPWASLKGLLLGNIRRVWNSPVSVMTVLNLGLKAPAYLCGRKARLTAYAENVLLLGGLCLIEL